MAFWAIPAAMAATGTVLSAAGKLRAGDSAKKRAKWEAAYMEQQAGQEEAAAQRRALEYDRQGRLQMSRALAVAAASGGGASDPTVMDIMGDIAGDAAYRRMVALYEGETEADRLRTGAAGRREEGDLAKRAGRLGALTTTLSGATSLYSKYGEHFDMPWLKDMGKGLSRTLGGAWRQLRYSGNEWANAPGPRR